MLPLLAVRRRAYARFADQGTNWWSRATGVAQMAVLVAALAPFSGSTIQWITRSLAQLISPLQLLSLAILARTFWKTPVSDDPAR